MLSKAVIGLYIGLHVHLKCHQEWTKITFRMIVKKKKKKKKQANLGTVHYFYGGGGGGGVEYGVGHECIFLNNLV